MSKAKWSGWIGMVLALVFMGVFSLAINQMTVQQFEEIFQRAFPTILNQMTAEAALAQFQTLGAWFGFTLLVLLILVSVATMLVRYRNYRKQSCAIYFLTGAVTLIGSQMIAFPIAFCFFLAAGFCLLHRDDGNKKKTTDAVSKQGGIA
ncbi:hypothetical protein ECBG_02110 [Enterococcus casseliflavus EC20]|uniref:DUF4064 domain-containing protein n=1 Tax=Enterococcus casseliflavus EC20 TaxID=565655 RepID=C9A525_ENTCA|nr:DUF4064 domain-containing protein [Enterococcus casseliflavus]EEV39841.1 hypothetical protein ECBG_02110 [Enterococcus casseliflavus EC20]